MRFRLITAACLLCLLALPALAAIVQETSITNAPRSQECPAVWGNLVIWQDSRSLEWDLYAFDLSTGTEFPVCTLTGNQLYPRICGNRYVWQDDRNGSNDIFIGDLAAHTEQQVSSSAESEQSPDIDGPWAVWQQVDGTNLIFTYDQQTGATSQLSLDYWQHLKPAVSGNRVVWQDDRNGNYDIYMQDLTTGQETAVCIDPSEQSSPVIDGDRVAWVDMRNGDYDIYVYDIPTGTERRVTTDTSFQYAPTLSGNVVVWTDWRNGNPDIYAYDLSAGEEFPVCIDPSSQYSAAIHGNKIVWADERNGYPDIYMATVEGNEPPPPPPDTEPPVISISATPSILAPVNGRRVPVVVNGSAEDEGSGVASLVFTVQDEYGRIQPTLTDFGQPIMLKATRHHRDLDGRTYTITVTATDNAGNQAVASTTVLVPQKLLKPEPGYRGSRR